MASQRLIALFLIGLACLFSATDAEDKCSVNDEEYKVGQSFITKDCNGRCQCNAGGGISCTSLCPPTRVACSPGKKIEEKKEAVPGSDDRCFCTVPYCVEIQECVVDGVKYKAGQSFISKDCNGRCKCNEGGRVSCVSLCPPVQVACSPGQKVVEDKQTVGDGNCFCMVPRCV